VTKISPKTEERIGHVFVGIMYGMVMVSIAMVYAIAVTGVTTYFALVYYAVNGKMP
jgi:hypothetical protein